MGPHLTSTRDGLISVVISALVDYDYKFTYVYVGCQSRIRDGGVCRSSSFFEALIQNRLKMPLPQTPPLSDDLQWDENGFDAPEPVLYVFVGDDSLGKEKRVFNYRLSHERRLSENMFGIWGSRLRIFHTSIYL